MRFVLRPSRFSFRDLVSLLVPALALTFAFAFTASSASAQPVTVATPPIAAVDPKGTYYLFTYFVGNGEDGLHLAWSADGYTWSNVKAGSYLTPVVGEKKLMRDPCVTRGPDGTYHMVWTTAWEGVTIGYASTKDFLTWSDQQAIPVMAHEPTVQNCWAPEIAYDPAKKDFFIYWASTIPGKFPETASKAEKGGNHRFYVTRTKDFKTYSPTTLFYDPGFNVIDATIIPALGKFYMVLKDETPLPQPKKYLQVASSDHIDGPFANLSEPITKGWVEGPTILPVGDAFLIYFDVYREKHYGAVRTRDFKTFEDVTAQISLPKGVRHGTALAVPGAIIAKLLTASANEALNAPPQPVPTK